MKKKRILFVLLILVILASCNTPRYAYSPSAHNVPVLAKKGDSKLGAVYSTNFAGERDIDGETVDERTRGIDVHGAVAISDHFAIQAAYFYRWEKTTGGNDTATIRYNRNLGEFGIGDVATGADVGIEIGLLDQAVAEEAIGETRGVAQQVLHGHRPHWCDQFE